MVAEHIEALWQPQQAIDKTLIDYLDAFGAVCIEEPKWCGKTTTAKRFSSSFIELQDTDKRNGYFALLR